jgi:hypothetical protein
VARSPPGEYVVAVPDLYAQYLKWYHDRAAKKRWATFEPTTQIVDVGDYGRFGNDLLFSTAPGQNIGKKLGIEVDLLPEVTLDAFLNLDAGGFAVSLDGGPTVTFPLHLPLLVRAGAKVNIEGQSDHWFALQVRQAKMIEMANALDVQEKVREAYLARKWPLDYYVVTECIRCSDGFVIMAESKWSGFEVTFDADVTILNHSDLAKGRLSSMHKFSDSAYEPYVFSGSDASGRFPTPTFKAPIGINRKKWAELLGMRKIGNELVAADGNRWPVRKTPLNLLHLTEDQRLYEPDTEGVPSPDEIRQIPLDEFFETFENLDEVFYVYQDPQAVTVTSPR